MEDGESAIGKPVPYRSDRSPLMAGCAVIWARLGETNRGVLARESCLARDHLRADTALLMLFALTLAPGEATLFPPPARRRLADAATETDPGFRDRRAAGCSSSASVLTAGLGFRGRVCDIPGNPDKASMAAAR